MIMNVTLDPGATLPTRAHEEDAGLDLYSREDKLVSWCGEFDTGVHVQLPKGFAGLLVSKSGLNCNHDITSTGLIDEGFTGTIKVKLYNHGRDPYQVKKGDKISQLVVFPVCHPEVRQVEKLQGGPRGNKGYGSSGR